MKTMNALRSLYRTVMPSAVVHQGVTLPAQHLRLCGKEFRDDSFFIASAKLEAARLRQHCGMDHNSRILDVGCGVGRLAIGLLMEPNIVSYTGLDVDESCVRWCSRHLAHPKFGFQRIDVANRLYNPNGIVSQSAFHFPFADKSFDIIYLYSVFSHMEPEGVGAYLAEFRRLLASRGTVFCTAFVEEGVPDVTENPAGYRMKWSGPLHCVRYNRPFLENLIKQHGLVLRQFVHGKETDGQSALYLSLANNKSESL